MQDMAWTCLFELRAAPPHPAGMPLGHEIGVQLR